MSITPERLVNYLNRHGIVASVCVCHADCIEAASIYVESWRSTPLCQSEIDHVPANINAIRQWLGY